MFWCLPKGQTRPAIDPVVIAQSLASSQNAFYNLSMTQSCLSSVVCKKRMKIVTCQRTNSILFHIRRGTLVTKTHFDMQIHKLHKTPQGKLMLSISYFGETTWYLGWCDANDSACLFISFLSLICPFYRFEDHGHCLEADYKNVPSGIYLLEITNFWMDVFACREDAGQFLLLTWFVSR